MKETSQEVYDIIYNLNLDNFLTEKKTPCDLKNVLRKYYFFRRDTEITGLTVHKRVDNFLQTLKMKTQIFSTSHAK